MSSGKIAATPALSAVSAEPSLKPAWITVGVLWVFYIFAMIDRQILNMLVDPIRRELDITDLEASLLLGFSFALFYTTVGLLIGWLVDRYSRRSILFISTSLWGLATAACGLVDTFGELLFARMLVGVGEAALGPAAYSMLADAFPKRRLAFALSVYTTGALVGGAIAILAGGFVVQWGSSLGHHAVPLLGEISSWRLAFLVTGLPGPLVALLAFLVPEPQRGALDSYAQQQQAAGLVHFVRQRWPLFALLCFGFGGMNMILSSVFAWSPTYMARSLAVAPVLIGSLIALKLLLGALPGQLYSGWLVDRWVERGRSDAYLRYFLIAVPLSAPFGIAALLSRSVALFVIGMLPLYFVCLSFMGVASTAVQVITPPVFRGRVSAFFLMITSIIGLGLGPTLVAWIASTLDPQGGAIGTALAIVVAGAASVAIAALSLARRFFNRAILPMPHMTTSRPSEPAGCATALRR